MNRLIVMLLALAAAAGLLGALAIYAGFYDISATSQHLKPTYRILEIAMRRSIQQRASEIQVPPLERPATIERGLALFREHCVQCHGAPGVAPEPFSLGLQPVPANLALTAREWSPAEVYWTVKKGIRMTGMPAWEFRLVDADLWAVVAFVMKLSELSPRDYQALVPATEPHAYEPERPPGRPDPERGKTAILSYACIACHRIPGIVGPDAPVGPPLDGIGTRAFIAGVLPNEPGNMERWLRSPQEVSPSSAMPDLGVGARDARDMAAYLATLR
jgi:mono/diheme cytochrome c family protein